MPEEGDFEEQLRDLMDGGSIYGCEIRIDANGATILQVYNKKRRVCFEICGDVAFDLNGKVST